MQSPSHQNLQQSRKDFAQMQPIPSPIGNQQEYEQVLLAEAVAALRQSHYSVLRFLSVSVQDDVMVLEGVVASFYLKQLALQAVLRVHGRATIRNELVVASRPELINR
jgi:osmotically-inducible protein OsmY